VSEKIEKASQYEDSPQGWQRRWQVEFEAARDRLKEFHDQGEKVEDRYRDERDAKMRGESRLNLFHGDVETKKAMLYGNPPQVKVRRKFADAKDDVARVAGEMLERLLQCDMERGSDTYRTALGMARDDRLLPGLGAVRMRYEVEWAKQPAQPAVTAPGPCPCGEGGLPPDPGCDNCEGSGEAEMELAPEIPEQDVKAHEDVATDYTHWRDLLWSVSRFWDENRWTAWRTEMTRDAMHQRFDDVLGSELVNQIPLNAEKRERKGSRKEDPWSRAEVWEIWNKDTKEVFWYVDGFTRVLDRKPDPLGLDNFWPGPRPLFANLTNSSLVPRADFVIAQDGYNEIDVLSTRINLLESSLKVAGVYDKKFPELGRVLKGSDNIMVPVDNWAMMAEKGGLKGIVDWFPLDQVVGALDKLGQKRMEKIQLLYQVTGMSDIMRGQGQAGATATEQRIKARASSTRTQAAQDEFARFATEAQQIRAEIIAKHWDANTIIERSNIMRTEDAQLAQQAAGLIKSDLASYRIEISADGLAMTDYDALKAERTEVIEALGQLSQAAAPLVQMAGPPAIKMFARLAQWVLASTRGSSTSAPIFDDFVKEMEQKAAQPPPPPLPDPAAEAAKAQAQVDIQKSQMDMQATQAKHGMDMQKAQMDLQGAQVKHGIEMEKMKADVQLDAMKTKNQLEIIKAKPKPGDSNG
jgi:hypothetical protein